MLEEEEELDDETVQAKVDASLAKIYSVTSTWLKPKKTPSVPKKDFEKELEEITRRPPRLGVGAELPEKQVQSGLSEIRLKNKMLGKKRGRGEVNSNDATIVPAPEDDEEESRSRVIQKKTRLDPFAPNKKKGKGLLVPATVSPHKLAGRPPAFETKPEKERIVAASPMDVDTPGSSSSKNTLNVASTSEPIPDASGLGNAGKEKESTAESVGAIPKSIPNLPPILNLHGPPAIRDDTEPSPRKKRRKKKKKHRAGGEAGVAPRTPAG